MTPDRYLSRRSVRQRYGGISNMTLWRWEHDASLNFVSAVLIPPFARSSEERG